jgi:hypothetical protein
LIASSFCLRLMPSAHAARESASHTLPLNSHS